MNDFPRRIQMLKWCPAEKAIYDAMQVVEGMAADVRLTDAVVLLGKARDRVADFIDDVPGLEKPPDEIAHRIANLSADELLDIARGVEQAGGLMMQWPSVLRKALLRALGGVSRALPHAEWEKRLQHLAAMPDNWNSYGSPPITPAALAAARKWLTSIVIVPRNNGGLMLGVDENGQAVSVEPDGSFAACDCGEPVSHAFPEPTPAAIEAGWNANARCGVYAASKEGIAAALRAGYAVDFGGGRSREGGAG